MKAEKISDRFLPPLWILTLLAAALFLWLTYQLKELVVLLVAGYAIAYLIDPILDFMERRKISRTIGLFVFLGIILIAALLAITTVFPILLDEFRKLSNNFPTYIALAKERIFLLIESLKMHMPKEMQAKFDTLTPESILPSITGDTLNNLTGGVLSALLKGYSVTLTIINLLLLPFIVFYLSVDFDKNHKIIMTLIPKQYRQTGAEIAEEIDTYVSAFVHGQFIVGTILFTLYTLGLGLIGVELWFLLAVISGFGNFVPYLGFCVGIVLSSIMALVTFQDMNHLYWVWGLYAVIQTLSDTFIAPKVIGQKVGLSPLGIILAIFAASKIFGILGLMLAVPIAAVVKVLFRRLHRWVVKKI
jgi:predicted PurR-regulated permease PerM